MPRFLAALPAVAFAAAAAEAQTLGLDLQLANRYEWRGLMRAGAWVAQPSLLGTTGELCTGSQALCASLAAGGWTNLQLVRTGANTLSDLPPGRRGFSEWDLWVEAAARHELFEAAAGVVRYLYARADSGGFRTPADNTTEVYARLRLPRVPWAKPTLVAWWDVDRVKGWFVEASADGGLGLLPMIANLDLGVSAGMSLGQERNPAAPTEAFNSERSGLTYVEFRAGPSLNFGAIPRLEPLRVAVVGHLQVSTDDLTKRAWRLSSTTPPVFFWLTVSASWTWATTH